MTHYIFGDHVLGHWYFTNTFDVIQNLKESAEKLQQLEHEHQCTIQQLQQKQDEIHSLQQVCMSVQNLMKFIPKGLLGCHAKQDEIHALTPIGLSVCPKYVKIDSLEQVCLSI